MWTTAAALETNIAAMPMWTIATTLGTDAATIPMWAAERGADTVPFEFI